MIGYQVRSLLCREALGPGGISDWAGRVADWQLTSSACFLPSYNTRSTLTFSRFPVSVLMLPRLCRSANAPRDTSGVGLPEREVRIGRAKRQIERVRNTILTDLCGYWREVLCGRRVVLLVVGQVKCGVEFGELPAAKKRNVS